MTFRDISLILVFSFCFISATYGQEHETSANSHDKEAHHEENKRHLISAAINHTAVFNALKNGETKRITLPSFSLNYTYFFNEKWAIGLHNDIILEDFVVTKSGTTKATSGSEDPDVVGINRGTPIAAAIVGIYKPIPRLGFFAGFGREFSSHEDYDVVRFGVESPYHLPNHWELFGFASYDIMINAYESLTYGIGIGKSF